jgi:hypothetical protein
MIRHLPMMPDPIAARRLPGVASGACRIVIPERRGAKSAAVRSASTPTMLCELVEA